MLDKTIISPAVRALADAGHLAHAFLLEGENAQINAKYLATAALCTGDDKPCGVCAACKKAQSGNHPDIILLEPDKPTAPYKIDFIREIRADAYISPNEAERKVYIFTHADNISVQSQNALLKILEEPPATVMFIICCAERSKLLETVLSRLVLINCRGAAVSGDDESINAATSLITAAVNMKEYDLLKTVYPLTKDRTAFRQTLISLQRIIRSIYIIKCGGVSDEFEQTAALAPKITTRAAIKLADVTADAIRQIDTNGNIQLCSANLCAALKAALGQ